VGRGDVEIRGEARRRRRRSLVALRTGALKNAFDGKFPWRRSTFFERRPTEHRRPAARCRRDRHPECSRGGLSGLGARYRRARVMGGRTTVKTG
jgi:hypothetical protein